MVGVDGSPSAKAALRWAARHARMTGGQLHAVTAWETPSYYGRAPASAYEEAPAATADKVLTAAVHSVLGDDRSNLDLVESVVPGHPAQVLIDMSARGGLLVIGSHGHGAIAGTPIGPVSLQCVQHARCPVVVVRGA